MAKRPIQHILETESKNALNSALPSEWVVNYQESDYGIDAKVQIFENGNSTPYFFFVQLKSTEEIKSKTVVSYPFSNERLNEYREYPLPVFLVLFELKSKKLFCKWIYDFFAELPITNQNKLSNSGKTNIRFKQELDKEFIEFLVEDVKEYYFITEKLPEDFEQIYIKLDLNLSEELCIEIESKFKSWLRKNKNLNFIKIGNFTNPTFLFSRLSEISAISVISKANKFIYPFLESRSDENYIELVLSSLKLTLADALAISGRRNSTLDIITDVFIEEFPLSSTAHYIFSHPSWAIEYAVKNRNFEAFEIADKIVGSENDFYAQMLAFSSQFITSSPKLTQKKYRYFLTESIRKAKESKNKGVQSYNLANSFRVTNSLRKAINHYCKAIKYEPKYLEKSYWWAEIAGCFFLLDKFIWAERFYRKSVELGETRIPARYLLADSLIHQGKFEEASKELEIYLGETERPPANAILNKWLADFLLVNFGNSNRNKNESKDIVEKAIESKDLSEQINLLHEAIKKDPVSRFAWLNYTICLHSDLKQEDFDSLLVSAILNPTETDLWINLIVQMSSNPDIKQNGLNPFHLAIFCEAWRYKTELEDEFRNRLPEKYANTVLEAIEEMLENRLDIFLEDIPPITRYFS